MICNLSLADSTLILGATFCPLLLIVMFIWFLKLAIAEVRDKIVKYQLWKNTPCPNCIYFDDRRELKCAVNPCQALTKNAVDCRDFEPIIGIIVHEYSLSRIGEVHIGNG